MPGLEAAAAEIRYLLERGYPRQSVITYVCNHHRMDLDVRHMFTRVIYPQRTADSRKAKTRGCDKIDHTEVWIDGYNVLIGVESALRGDPVYLCDDGFLRDTRGVFRNFSCSDQTVQALEGILRILALHRPDRIEWLFDSQISKSGEMARWVEGKMQLSGIPGRARTSRHVDLDLKASNTMVATSDGGIIDAVESVVNLQACTLKGLQLRPIILEGVVQ